MPVEVAVELGDALAPDEPAALVALVAEMERAGCRFVVHLDEISYDGPELPEWCDAVMAHWVDVIVCAYAAAKTHRLYCCDTCCEVNLLTPKRAGRPCYMPGCAGHIANPLNVRFTDRSTS